MKTRSWVGASIAALSLSLGGALSPARADEVKADPIGFDEVPANVSPAEADFRAAINDDETEIRWELRFSGIVSNVTQAHIHVGKARTNGAVVLFACSNLPNPPAGTQACPLHEGKISGTWTSANVVDSAAAKAQGVLAGADALAAVIAAIRADAAYFNIHSEQFPGGEIRGQVRQGR
jgi:hypothetical protein